MTELRRALGPVTTTLVGLGIAIGSGIFRTPGTVAQALGDPAIVLGVWLLGGLFVIGSSLVSAELATRFPEAGGEYAYLREAYGPFSAFFFGWGYTVFIAGGGAATIAAATGEALAELCAWPQTWAPYLGSAAIGLVTTLNLLGLTVGAGLQNLLTVLKLLVVALVVGAAVWVGPGVGVWPSVPLGPSSFVAAFLPVLWAYEGSTDAVKLAEEVKDPARSMPRALLVSAGTLTIIYLVVNAALLYGLGPELAGTRFGASVVLGRLWGEVGPRIFAALASLVFLGALSSSLLATVRVTFALARDGLGFASLGRMSKGQAPIASFLLTAVIALVFTLFRGFGQILGIYFLAASVLFGLSYGSLLVFRARDRGRPVPPEQFRAPLGRATAVGLIGLQLFLAGMIVNDSPKDGLGTLVLLGICALLYWPLRARRSRAVASPQR